MPTRPEFIPLQDFKSHRLTARIGGGGGNKHKNKGKALRKSFARPIQTKRVNEALREVDYVISTDAVDRDGDTIDQQGWVIEAYRRNPVVLFGHDYGSLPVARAPTLTLGETATRATARFATREEYDFADTVYRLVIGGFMNAVSVGFIPLEVEDPDTGDKEDDERGPYALDFKRQELIEFSVVPVPSNPEALMEAAVKGIDCKPMGAWASRALDEWKVRGASLEEIGVDRKTLEDVSHIIETPNLRIWVPKHFEHFQINGLTNEEESALGEATLQQLADVVAQMADGEAEKINTETTEDLSASGEEECPGTETPGTGADLLLEAVRTLSENVNARFTALEARLVESTPPAQPTPKEVATPMVRITRAAKIQSGAFKIDPAALQRAIDSAVSAQLSPPPGQA